ncbi:MAG: CNNM domain-containing protein, partial [Erysipelotrichales bacterium]
MDLEPGSIQQILFIIVLIIINAFFSAAELAIVSVNKNKIETLASKDDKNAKILVGLMKDHNRFLSTIQVGITLAGFL